MRIIKKMVVSLMAICIAILPQMNVVLHADTITTKLDFTDSATPTTGDGYSFDAATKTLTLSEFDMTYSGTGGAIKVVPGTTIVLQGQNNIRLTRDTGTVYGISAEVSAGDADTITITGGGTLNITSTSNLTNSRGIQIDRNGIELVSLIINNVKLNITATSSGFSGIVGVYELKIENSEIDIDTGNTGITCSILNALNSSIKSHSTTQYGIISSMHSIIKNSNLDVKGASVAIWLSAAINEGYETIFDNSSITAETTSITGYPIEFRSTAGELTLKNDCIINLLGGAKSINWYWNFSGINKTITVENGNTTFENGFDLGNTKEFVINENAVVTIPTGKIFNANVATIINNGAILMSEVGAILGGDSTIICNSSHSKSIDGHQYILEVPSTTQNTIATCTTSGSKHYLCDICEEEIVETIPSLGGHKYSEWTYEDDTNHVRHCINNNDDTQREAHIFSEDWTIDIEPVGTSAGIKSHHCITPTCTAKKDSTKFENAIVGEQETATNDTIVNTNNPKTGDVTGDITVLLSMVTMSLFVSLNLLKVKKYEIKE